ncbi:MAG TPA: hypothetical protein VK914_04930 [bacterium]|jgi:hypothetical protein|nr:hypothetical protein [bacterium]
MPGRTARVLAPALCLALLCLGAGPAAAAARPLVTVLDICSSLAADTYPADTQNWFDPERNAQVVFYAQLLFPVDPLPDESLPAAPAQSWHPPMAVSAPPSSGSAPAEGQHYAEAEWLDPAGKGLALFGMTLTARAQRDWISVSGRSYIPHTFAMAIGTRDLRAAAGQTALPGQPGQYTVRLRVDGRSVGLAFFKMLRGAAAPAKPGAPSAPAAIQAISTPVPIPTLPALKLP